MPATENARLEIALTGWTKPDAFRDSQSVVPAATSMEVIDTIARYRNARSNDPKAVWVVRPMKVFMPVAERVDTIPEHITNARPMDLQRT